MPSSLNKQEYESVVQTLFKVRGFALSQSPVKDRFMKCINKWAAELGIPEKSLAEQEVEQVRRVEGEYDVFAVEALYDLVYLIHMDDILEEVELEIAMDYSEALGFKPHVVGDLAKAIVEAPHYDVQGLKLKEELQELLSINFSK